jgi:hypothetical protein
MQHARHYAEHSLCIILFHLHNIAMDPIILILSMRKFKSREHKYDFDTLGIVLARSGCEPMFLTILVYDDE